MFSSSRQPKKTIGYTRATQKQINPEDDIARTSETTIKCNSTTPQQLTLLYLQIVVLQLRDIVEKFGKTYN